MHDPGVLTNGFTETALRLRVDAHARGIAGDRVIGTPPLPDVFDCGSPGLRSWRRNRNLLNEREAGGCGVDDLGAGGSGQDH